MQEIPLNRISTKKNYRKTFNDKSLADLASSIKKNGVIEPIIVRPDGDNFVLVAGERRVRAANMAGLVTVPAVIREADDLDALTIQIVENVQRENVPFMEEAYALADLRDKGAFDNKEIAKIIGKSEIYVWYQLKIAGMAPDARRIAENGWISKSVAWEISKLKNEADQVKAANDLARTSRDKLVTSSGAKHYLRVNYGDSATRLSKERVKQHGSNSEYKNNWKFHLVRFDEDQFTSFKQICRGRTETEVLAEAVDLVMRKGDEAADAVEALTKDIVASAPKQRTARAAAGVHADPKKMQFNNA
jgi:ParB family chromosome partitioning protein